MTQLKNSPFLAGSQADLFSGQHLSLGLSGNTRRQPCYLTEDLKLQAVALLSQRAPANLSSGHTTPESPCKSEQVKTSFCRQVTEHINCNFIETVEI